MLYERALMDKWDAYAVKKTAREKLAKTLEKAKAEARKEGIQKGREEGIEKGIEKGRTVGRAEGNAEKSYEVVNKLLSTGKFTIAEIANFTGVSEGFVRSAKKRRK